jgi:hypothetical protein
MNGVKKALDAWAKETVKQARRNLTRNKKRASNSLYKSLGHEVTETPYGYDVNIYGNEYAKFVDQGVSGTERKFNTPYSYTTKQPPVSDLLPWVKRKRLRFRDEKGRFKRGDSKSMAFVVARNIKRRGLRPTLFLTNAAMSSLKRIAPELEEAYVFEIEKLLDERIDGTTR